MIITFCLLLFLQVFTASGQDSPPRDDVFRDKAKAIGLYYNMDEIMGIRGRIDAYQGPFGDYKAYLEAVMPEDFNLDRCSLKYLKRHYWCAPCIVMGSILYLSIKQDDVRYILYFPESCSAVSPDRNDGTPVYFTDNYISRDSSVIATDMKEEGYFLQPGNMFFFNREKRSVCIGRGHDDIRQFEAVRRLPKEVRKCLRKNASSPAESFVVQRDTLSDNSRRWWDPSLDGKPLRWWNPYDYEFRMNCRKR